VIIFDFHFDFIIKYLLNIFVIIFIKTKCITGATLISFLALLCCVCNNF